MTIKLELYLSRLTNRVEVENPTLISDELLDQAWHAMNATVMDILDTLEVEPTDEQFREIFIEVCYRLIFREVFTLNVLPVWEKRWQEGLGTRRRGTYINKKGSYDDSDWS